MKLGCVVMAAGESRRFGDVNKLLQAFDGIPLYVRALSAVPEGVFDRVCVVTGYAPIRSLAQEHGFLTAVNDRPELGVSRTIRLGLEQMQDCDGVVFMTADQPLLTAYTLRKLAAAFAEKPGCVFAAAHNGKRGNPCLFPRVLFGELLALEGDVGGSRVIKNHPDRLVLVEVAAEELEDCDTAESLKALRKRG